MAKLNIKNLAITAATRGGGALAGGAAGVAINHFLPSTMNPLLKNGLKALVGAVVPELVSPKNELVKYAGAGLIGQAGGELAATYVPFLAPKVAGTVGATSYTLDDDISGIDDTIYGTDDDVAGTYDDDISGADDDVSGTDDDVSGTDDETY